MLEHQMLVISNLSSDKDLFRKEVLKSFQWLQSYEIFRLHKWLRQNYGSTHREIITEVFNAYC